MKNIAEFSIEQPLYPWLLVLACLLGGIWGIDTVGRLEDPPFPIKTAFIITPYDGASAEEVEQEVTDIIEAALQELPYVDELTSKSVPGRSEVQVQMAEQFGEDEIPQIFDEMRRRIIEAGMRLPPGTGPSLVEDDFGDVYGILYALTAPGYSPGEIRDMSRHIASSLNLVPGVAKVQTNGEPFEAIYIEIDHERLVRLGLPIDAVFSSLSVENAVAPAGSVAYDGRRIRIAPAMAFDSVASVGDLRIGRPGSTEIIRLSDVARITREPIETPPEIIRHNGERVFTVGVSVIVGQNVVEVGKRVDARMRELVAELPVGVEMDPVYRQHASVEQSINEFLANLAMSVATVVGALCVFMGWRAGTVVGAVLLLTVFGTLGAMAAAGIPLQRISLGALMLAMGMLVDNAIVVAEGMVTGVQRGLSAKQAAAQSVKRTQWPLLGATVIGVLAFAPISLSDDNAGQFLGSLFQVVGISLMLSWILAVTLVPMLGARLLKPGEPVSDAQLYSGWMYAPYRVLIGFSLRHAWLATLVLVAITFSCIYGFGFLKQGFFPTTNTPLFFFEFRLPQGTDIHTTAASMERVEDLLEELDGVEAITSFIGRGSTRFMTTLRTEQPNSAYAIAVVRVADVRQMNAIMVRANEVVAPREPDLEIQVSRIEFSPGGSSKIEVRYSGPDAGVLRELADRTLAVYLEQGLIDRKIDWRQRELQLVPRFNETRARVSGITRSDVAQALAFATEGVRVGLFRDHDKLIPIIARAPDRERTDVAGLMERLIWSPAQQAHIPASQVIDSLDLVPRDSMIFRRDRTRTITAAANQLPGQNALATFARVRPALEAIEIPPGYSREWGGEYESSKEANDTLTTKIPLALGTMLLVTIVMFGALRQAAVIWLTIPMSVCGVVLALLLTDLSFTFPSFLGFLSLSGMLIKNCIVLVDEIDKRLAEGPHTLTTMMQASVSRLRPVLLAAGTTIVGMSPLLGDAFFKEMAVCIMGGLAFATILTLVAVPVFYRIALGRRVAPA